MFPKRIPVLSILLGLGVCAHLAAGWMDERRVAIRIVGPLSPFVGWWWMLILTVAIASTVRRRALSTLAIVAAVLAVCGIAGVWWYPG